VTEPSQAVFLSYASQDVQAAQRICEALRSAGIEVWFDQSELRGGDSWDRSIRRQIKSCALFVPVISKNTRDRDEGYFRLEWKLAVDRSHLMSANRAFLLPVVVDETRDDDQVPDSFRAVQWTRLPRGETTPAFVECVRRLLAPASRHTSTPGHEETRPLSATTPPAKALASASWSTRGSPLFIAAVAVLGAVVYLAIDKPRISKRSVSSPTVAFKAAPAAFAPPPHSIAVLPFLNMSGDAKQEYFSDGITEELINALSRLSDLQVVARTSSFSFKGQDVDIQTIARKLNVGAILEGSVRRDGKEVRITAQLINAVTGFHLWSQTYDRKLTDILKVQTDVATSVAAQLERKITGDETDKIEVGGTHNPDAYDAYLRGAEYMATADTDAQYRAALAAFDRAVKLDSGYAAAYAQRARTLSDLAILETKEGHDKQLYRLARQSAERAVALAPDFADAHAALGWHVLSVGYLDFQNGAYEIERALSLAPGSAYVLRTVAAFQGLLGHSARAQAAIVQAIKLDPENYRIRVDRAWLLYWSHNFVQAQSANRDAIALNSAGHDTGEIAATSLLALGRPEEAQRVCEAAATPLDDDVRHECLAIAYHMLGKIKEGENELKIFRSITADSEPVRCADIYAQWGNARAALRWLTRAETRRDSELTTLRVDWMLDPIRNEPQFKVIEARMHFPS
jgi:TolB-like protein/tetratricopeptide (TPR) repeat protein